MKANCLQLHSTTIDPLCPHTHKIQYPPARIFTYKRPWLTDLVPFNSNWLFINQNGAANVGLVFSHCTRVTLIRRGVALHINVDFHFSDFYLMALRETSQLKRFLIFVKDNVSFPYLSKKKKKKRGCGEDNKCVRDSTRGLHPRPFCTFPPISTHTTPQPTVYLESIRLSWKPLAKMALLLLFIIFTRDVQAVEKNVKIDKSSETWASNWNSIDGTTSTCCNSTRLKKLCVSNISVDLSLLTFLPKVV